MSASFSAAAFLASSSAATRFFFELDISQLTFKIGNMFAQPVVFLQHFLQLIRRAASISV
ncbi:MAG: hypothetical protein JST01_08230 [Cyanobacteria bacterium SZAS TMP-1]|nr:hypothetical protein [Cyanobacteria bacterium SZAS TMP-1]